MKRRWQKYLLYASIIIAGGFILFETVRLKNTGFEGKSLWDWMELLIIPLVLAIGAFYLNSSERNTEREIATDRQQEAALQSYLDRMADLLLKEQLSKTGNKEVRNVARTRTLTLLRGLDGPRKGIVLRFIYESKLIDHDKFLVDLENADFSGADLVDVILADAWLPYVDLSKADLGNAFLDNINLLGSKLIDANLAGADLRGAKLINADFSNADLHDANLGPFVTGLINETGIHEYKSKDTDLSGANLTGTNLRGAVVTNEQLATVESLKGATMPDGTIHE